MEGTAPGDLSVVNNNPGNLRYAGQAGSVGSNKGYAVFTTPEAGWAALERQLQLDASRGDTLAKFIGEYAPSSENATEDYLAYLMRGLGVSATTPLSTILGQPAQIGAGSWDGGVSTEFGSGYTEAGILGDLGQVPTWAWLGLIAGAGVLVMVKARD
jgi:hypothetical protein